MTYDMGVPMVSQAAAGDGSWMADRRTWAWRGRLPQVGWRVTWNGFWWVWRWR